MFDNPLAPTKCVIDSKAGVEALQFISDLYYKYRVSPSSVAPSPGGWDSGKIAMTMSGTWYIEQARLMKKIKWDIAPLPAGKDRVIPYFLGSYVVAKTTKNPIEAWKFAKFFQSREAQQLIARDGLIAPMMRSVAQSDAFLKVAGSPAHHRVRLDGLSRARLADPLHVRFPKPE